MIALSLGPAEVRFTARADGDLGRTDRELPLDAEVGTARDRVLRACGLRAIAAGRQVHGARVVPAAAALGYAVSAEPADGQLTRTAGAGVAVHVADCLPVALAGAEGVAMLHAGWRGLAAGVLEAGVTALGGAVAAAIGPGARGCCYEAGEEVHRALPGCSRGRCVDLPAAARARLGAAGVAAIEDVELCTLCGPAGLLFSHRRDGPGPTGRQAGVAWLR